MADALVEPANDFFSVDDDPFGDDEFAAPPPSSPVEPVKTVPRRERWLKLLGLSESASTRDGYNAKVARHTAGLSDDPLAASPFDAASQSIRADLSRGLGFDDSHPLAIAAKAGALYSAELAVGVWLLEHPQTSYQSSMGVLAGVIALALTADGAKLSNEDEAEGSGDADHVDCYCLLEALLEAMHYLLFENASSNMTSPLEACAAKLICVDPELHDHLEALKLPLAAHPQLAETPAGSAGAAIEPVGTANIDPPASGTSEPSSSSPWCSVWCSTLLAKQSGSSSDGLLAVWDEVFENLQKHRDKGEEAEEEGDDEETGRDSLPLNDESIASSERPSDSALAVEDDDLSSTKSTLSGVVNVEVWTDVLAPLVVATLVTQRQRLLAANDPASAAALLLGDSIEPSSEKVGARGNHSMNRAQQVVYLSRLVRDPTLQATIEAQCTVVTFAAGPLGLVLGQKETDKVPASAPTTGMLRVRKFQKDPARGGPMQAEFSGQIEVGDALVAVNGVPVAANLTPQLLGALLGRVGRPVHVAFRKCPPAPTPPAPPPTLAPASGTSAGNGRSAINSGGGSDGGSDSKSTEGWAAWSAAAAAAADSMDPEVYAAAAAAASHMGSLALAGLGAAGVMDASSSSSKLPHDRSGSPGLLSLEDSDLSRSSNLYAESGGLQGGDDGKGESTGVTHAEDGFELPRLLGECYSASLNGVQMEAFHRARLGDGGLQRTWVRGQLLVSNYRLYFHAAPRTLRGTTLWPDWGIPVHYVCTLEASKSHDNQGPNGSGRMGRTLIIGFKDGQMKRFSSVRAVEEAHVLTDEMYALQRSLVRQAFKPEETFAKAHAKASLEAHEKALQEYTALTQAASLAGDSSAAAAEGVGPVPRSPVPAPSSPFCLAALGLQADFDRLGLASYSKLRVVRQDQLMLCNTYPLLMLVPKSFPEDDLHAVAKFRSKQRLPVVTWFDVRTGAHIARASQPSVGLVNSKRCLEDERLVRELAALTFREVLNEEGDVVWAPCTYYIVDARSKLAARGNAAMGKGTEQVKYYRDGRHATDLQFMNIDNIHKVRESCDELYGLGRPGALEGSASATGFSGRVDQTGWLHQVVLILKASNSVVEAVTREKAGVLVHCSDGWDRTPQITALAQLCIDAHYRTIQGFACLVEKEWLAYGHKFSERCAHSHPSDGKPSEEQSPVFLLWLDCVWQVLRQFPTILEFNEAFLLALNDHLYSCRFGSFLSNSYIERNKHHGETLPVWGWVEQRLEDFKNPLYEKYTEGPVLPSVNPKNVVLWEAYFQRFDSSKLPYNPKHADPTTYYD